MSKIQEQTEYPRGATRYFLAHPDDARVVAMALIDHISTFFPNISVHMKKEKFGGHEAVLLWSGNPDFYFGVGEGNQAPKYLRGWLDVDMTTQTDTLGKAERSVASGQSLLTMSVENLPKLIPQMWAYRDGLIAKGEALLHNGYDKTPAGLSAVVRSYTLQEDVKAPRPKLGPAK